MAVFLLRTHGVYYGGCVSGMAGIAGTLALILARCSEQGLESRMETPNILICHTKQTLDMPQGTMPTPSALSTP